MSGRSGTATCAQGANPSAIKRGRRLPYCLLLIALLLGAAILKKDGGAGFPTAKPRSTAQWAHLYAALPLSFEANRGQTDPSVNFLSRGRGYALFLTGQEAVLNAKEVVSRHTPPPWTGQNNQGGEQTRTRSPPATCGCECPGAMTGQDELPGKANYFLGNDPSKWRTNVPTYAKVRYESVYPGVDLVYYGTQGGELEYDFVVAPGADPNAIALGVETPDGVRYVQLRRGPGRSNRGPRSAPSQTGHIPASGRTWRRDPESGTADTRRGSLCPGRAKPRSLRAWPL